MAYDLRHTGAEIDEAVSAVESGKVVIDNTLSALDETSNKPVDSKGIAGAITQATDSINDKLTELSAEIGRKKRDLDLNVWHDGKYVSYETTLLNSLSAYDVFRPIYLKKGDILTYKTLCKNIVAELAKVNDHLSDKPSFVPLVEGRSNYAAEYTYTIKEDGYYVLSGRDATQYPNNITTAYIIEPNLASKVETLEQKTEKLIVLPSKNLFNPDDSDVLIGYYVYGSTLEANTTYNTTGYIAVEPNTTYYAANAKGSINPRFRFVTFYNENKEIYGPAALDGEAYSFTTPEGCYFVRVSFYSDSSVWPYAQIAKEPMDYIPYGSALGIKPSSSDNPGRIATFGDIPNVLHGKKWAVVGDSFTAGFASSRPSDWFIQEGKYKGKSKVYGYLIANRNNMTLQFLGAGGKTMATPSDGSFANTFSLSEYKNIDVDVDYITIYLGINDSHHAPGSTGDDGENKSGEIPIGTIDDTTTATFYGAWNVVIPYLIEKHPFAHIGIIVSNGCDTEDYREAEIAIARKFGLPFIDLNGDDRTPCQLRSQNKSISSVARDLRTKAQSIDYDGSVTGTINKHPNKDAHAELADIIEGWLRTI